MMTTKLLAGWFPAPLRPLVPLGVRALLDERALEAFGFEPAPIALRAATEGILRLRAGVLRYLLPARRRPSCAPASRGAPTRAVTRWTRSGPAWRPRVRAGRS
jgi:hypothetical protein